MEVLNKKLQVRNLCKSFDSKKVLDNITFDVYEGEFLSVLGVSGCGKTTLLRILIGLETADSGEIIKGEQDISHLPSFERGMGIVFQNYALFPNMTVLQNVEYALKLHKETAATARQTALDTLEQIGMTDQLKKKPHQLSGGQQQRVAIGRALITKPKLILADEPTGNLDSKNSQDVIALLTQASRRYQQTILMITHNKNLTTSVDRVFRVSDGILTDLGGNTDEALS